VSIRYGGDGSHHLLDRIHLSTLRYRFGVLGGHIGIMDIG
jgi:hypothetical protein